MKKHTCTLSLLLLSLFLSACQPVPKSTANQEASQKQVEKTTNSQATPTQKTPDPVNQGPDYTEESNQLFIQYLKEKSSDLFNTAEAISNDKMTILVPDGFPDANYTHQIGYANSLLGLKNKLFADWSEENGYDSQFIKPPYLQFKINDGTVVAEETDDHEKMEILD